MIGNFKIRAAKSSDLQEIGSWLALEAEGARGFIHNWKMIEEACLEENMLVCVIDDDVIGFLTSGVSRSSILQIRSDCKRRGAGRALVLAGIAAEEENGNPIQVIQCEPKSSSSFWRSVGFHYYRGYNEASDDTLYLYHLSAKEHLVDATVDFPVKLSTFHSSHLHENSRDMADQVRFALGHYDDLNDTLQLDHRMFVVNEGALADVVVELNICGTVILSDKAKYEASIAAGFQRCTNGEGWFIDIVDKPFSRIPHS